MKPLYLLFVSVINASITILDLLDHNYWGIITGGFAVMAFGLYIHKLITSLTIPAKPKKEENIYE